MYPCEAALLFPMKIGLAWRLQNCLWRFQFHRKNKLQNLRKGSQTREIKAAMQQGMSNATKSYVQVQTMKTMRVIGVSNYIN